MFINWIRDVRGRHSRRRPAVRAKRHVIRGNHVSAQVQKLEDRTLLAFGSPIWVEQGPGPITGGQTEGLTSQNDPVTGAINAIAAHPTNPDIAVVAAINGGIWRTTNATSPNPTWTAVNDQLPSLAISDIAYSPVNSNVLYAATGSFSSGGSDGGLPAGVLKSSDGGITWAKVGGSVLDGIHIRSVVPTSLNGGQVVLVAGAIGTAGVYRSVDGGASFSRISGNGASGLPGNLAAVDLVADPGNPNRFYAAIGISSVGQGIYRSTDGGVTWVNVSAGITGLGGAAVRMRMAVHNNSAAGTNALYVGVIAGANGQLTGVFRSADQGNSWTAMDVPTTNEGGVTTGIVPRLKSPDIVPESAGGQGAIHFSILADRTNPNVVYLGGDRQPGPGDPGATFPNSIGARNYSGRHFRVDASRPRGSQATPMNANFANGTSPHADSRDMEFDANGNILEGDDGGIYRLSTPGNTTTQRWSSVIGNMRVTEFYGVAYDPVNNTVLGGTQDVGTPRQSIPGDFTWPEVTQGDGGITQVDTTTIPGSAIHYTSFQRFGAFQRSVINSSSTVVSTTFVGLVVNGRAGLTLTQTDFNVQFIQPYVLNAVTPARMLIGTADLYESFNQGDTLNFLGGFANAFVRGMAYGGRRGGVPNPDVIYAGFGATLKVRTTLTGPLATMSAYRGGAIEDIVLNPDDWQEAYIADTVGRVYRTTDGGASFTDVTANLGTLVTDIRSIEIYGNTSSIGDEVIVVGGLGGVFAASVANLPYSTPWVEFGTSFPNVLVTDVRYDLTDNLLLAGTFGRGAWTVSQFSTFMSLPPVLVASATPAFFQEKAPPAVIDTSAYVTDPDSADFGGGSLTVQMTTGGTVDDYIGIRHEGFGLTQIGVVGNIVSFGGVNFGTFVGGTGTTPLVVSFNANASLPAVTALLRNVTFQNVSDNPPLGGRPIEFSIKDGDGGVSNTAGRPVVIGPVEDPPQLATISSQTVVEQSQLTFTISATDPDTPSANLVYSASQLPLGATFDPATQTFSWTPSEDQGPGQFLVRFSVTDGLFVSSQIVTVSVTESNLPPAFTMAGVQSVEESNILEFAITASDPDLPLNILSFSVANLPFGATFDPIERKFNWTPSETQGPASYVVTFTVSDGLVAVSKAVDITVVELNQLPVFPPLNDVTVQEGELIQLTVGATDADLPANALNYFAGNLPTGAVFDSGTRTLTWLPSEAQGPGVFNLQFSVNDGTASVTQSMTITVLEVNRPPVLPQIAAQFVDEENTLNFFLGGTDPDLPRNTITFSAANLPSGARFDSTTGLFSWTPTETQGGLNYEVTFEVTDGSLSHSRTAFIRVNDTRRPDLLNVAFTVDDNDLTAGESVNVGYAVQNTGDSAAAPFRVDFYIVGTTDGNTTQKTLLSQQFPVGLGAKASPGLQVVPVTLPAPLDPFWKGDGSYVLGVLVDAGKEVSEINEGNNSTQGIGLDTAPVTVLGTQGTLPPSSLGAVRMLRAYNPQADYHFFTTSQVEFANAVAHGYRDESTGQSGFAALSTAVNGATAIHRLYNPNNGRHYYTASDAELSFLLRVGWRYEKDEGFINPAPVTGATEIFRLYNKNSGVHLYTQSAANKDAILSNFPGIWEQHSSLGYAFIINPAGNIQLAVAAATKQQTTAAAVSLPMLMETATEDSTEENATPTIAVDAVAEASTSSDAAAITNGSNVTADSPTLTSTADQDELDELFTADIGELLSPLL